MLDQGCGLGCLFEHVLSTDQHELQARCEGYHSRVGTGMPLEQILFVAFGGWMSQGQMFGYPTFGQPIGQPARNSARAQMAKANTRRPAVVSGV